MENNFKHISCSMKMSMHNSGNISIVRNVVQEKDITSCAQKCALIGIDHFLSVHSVTNSDVTSVKIRWEKWKAL